MRVVSKIGEVRDLVASARRRGLSVGLVPTMGYLHHGHMALVERSRAETGLTVVSIFVNPTQFGPGEDFDAYPRDLERDLALCREHGVDAVFHPDAAEMYPEPSRTSVEVANLSAILIGAQRPGHFRGVATVVAKLFNIVEPDRAFFGEKDFQQLAVVRRMALDLSMRVAIVGVPTVREPDGLAASSRNVRLTAAERRAAPAIRRGLLAAEALFRAGEREAGPLVNALRAAVAAEPAIALLSVDLRDGATLEPAERLSDRPGVLLVTARLGSVVLIDQHELRTNEGMGGAR